MKTIKDLGLTKLEETILSCLIDGLYAEPGFSDVDAKDIASEIGIDIKSVRGGVGSLVKKGLNIVTGKQLKMEIGRAHV